MRLFIALELPEVRPALAKWQGQLKRLGADVKWVEPSNLHLTLHFLGEVADGRRELAGEAMSAAARQAEPVTVAVEGCGVFPHWRQPRVIWAGVKGDLAVLEELHRQLGRELVKLGFHLESRGFSPHITLGRVRSDQGRQQLADFLQQHNPGKLGEQSISEVVLWESKLTPQGPNYTPWQRALLGTSRHASTKL